MMIYKSFCKANQLLDFLWINSPHKVNISTLGSLQKMSMLDNLIIGFMTVVGVDHAESDSKLGSIVCRHYDRVAVGNFNNEHVEAQNRVGYDKEESAQGAAQPWPGPFDVFAENLQARDGTPHHEQKQGHVEGHEYFEDVVAYEGDVEGAHGQGKSDQGECQAEVVGLDAECGEIEDVCDCEG